MENKTELTEHIMTIVRKGYEAPKKYSGGFYCESPRLKCYKQCKFCKSEK